MYSFSLLTNLFLISAIANLDAMIWVLDPGQVSALIVGTLLVMCDLLNPKASLQIWVVYDKKGSQMCGA